VFKLVLKILTGVLALAIIGQALPAYYRSNEFDYFLTHETKGSVTEQQLKRQLLSKAREYSLPVKEENISISTVGRTYRVAVHYTVPIDLLVYKHGLNFRSQSVGWLPR
jgi:hypothetical protein